MTTREALAGAHALLEVAVYLNSDGTISKLTKKEWQKLRAAARTVAKLLEALV